MNVVSDSDQTSQDDSACDFSDRNHFGVPISLVPPHSELALLVYAVGYKAFTWNATAQQWQETGRQDQLIDTKTRHIIGDISADATTVESGDYTYVYSYFADGSYTTSAGSQTNVTNPCDSTGTSAPVAQYPIASSSSSFPGVLTCVFFVAVFDTEGGLAPIKPGKYDCQVAIVHESSHLAFYRSAIGPVYPVQQYQYDEQNYQVQYYQGQQAYPQQGYQDYESYQSFKSYKRV